MRRVAVSWVAMPFVDFDGGTGRDKARQSKRMSCARGSVMASVVPGTQAGIKIGSVRSTSERVKV